LTETQTFDGRGFARELTSAPGVYRMLGEADQVLYIGKARNLSNRVASYFVKQHASFRITAMVRQIRRIEVTVTRSEGEALLLENQLIKAQRPRYNILLRDDKSYPYVFLARNTDFPRLAFHRGARDGVGEYFGPYPGAHAVRDALSLMQKLFRVRQCEDSYFANRTRPCLQYQIKRCSAPCVGYIDAPSYGHDVDLAALFLAGKSQHVIETLGHDMERAAAALEFEQAARIRDQIATLNAVRARQFVAGGDGHLDLVACVGGEQGWCVYVTFFRGGANVGSREHFPKVPDASTTGEVLSAFLSQHYLGGALPNELIVSEEPEQAELFREVFREQAKREVAITWAPRGERARWLESAVANAHEALKRAHADRATYRMRMDALTQLLKLERAPERIECFDISHTMGEATVASCVVFDDAGPRKSDYRRFNIEGITGGDDFAAMRQAFERRYQRQLREGARLPDLILIDGGVGQLRQAREVAAALGLTTPLLVGVAKGPERTPGHEDLWLPGAAVPLWPGPTSPASHLIQQIRDEAHRFAITGHRARRQKARVSSSIEEIPGIGAVRRRALLKHFGGLRGLKRAGIEELKQVKGISGELAEQIYAAMHLKG
jgi:excinuclease ABC subunit C